MKRKEIFFLARHKVEIANVDTSKLEVLNHKEMLDLFKKLKEGDITAKEKLINGNLKLVLSILKKYTNRTENMDDLFQVGCIGLIKAIDNFDLAHEVRFSTYAVPMILGEVKRYLRDNNSIRISRSIKDLAYKALKIKEYLTNKYNREITIKELSDYMQISENEIVEAIESTYDTVSIFEPIFNDGGETIYLFDQLKDTKNNLYPLEYYIALKEALKNLKEKERYILKERYIIGKTQIELAEEIGISQAQISRLEKNGIENLKRLIK